MDNDEIIWGATLFVGLLISLTIHEWAHAFTAWKLGDDTAASQGRLTFNPLAHADPMGTLLLPALMIFSGANFLFGWAKPVPVDPTRFRRGVNMHRGMLITSLAGPASNLVLAVLIFLLLRVAAKYQLMPDNYFDPIKVAGFLNVLLVVFNLLPVPPLDGHRMLPSSVQEALRPYSMLLFIGLLALIWTSGGLVNRVVLSISRAIYQFFVWLI